MHGYTSKCPGCIAILRKTARQGHSEGCRRRLEAEMKEEPRVKTSRQREDEFIEKVIERDDSERKKARIQSSVGVKPESSQNISAGIGEAEGDVDMSDDMPEKVVLGDEHIQQCAYFVGFKGNLEDSMALDISDANPVLMETCQGPTNVYELDEWTMDDLTGKALDQKLVKAARAEEVEFLKMKEIYTEVSREER